MPALIATLLEAERRLEELTAGEVDTVADGGGRTFLLRRAQEALRHREAAKQAAILNALPAHIALLDPQGLVVSANDAWRRFASTGAVEEQAAGAGVNYLHVCAPGHRSDSPAAHDVAEGIRAVLAGGTLFATEYVCASPTGAQRFLLTVTPLADDTPKGVIVMRRDITAERQTEDLLRASELRFRQMADSSRDVFFLQSLDSSQMLYVSPAYEKIWGRTCDSLYATPQSWADAIHPDDLQDTLTAFEAGRATGFDHEFRIVRPDGGIRWMHVRGFPVLDDAGRPYRITGVVSDVTQRKEASGDLRESEERFRATFEQAAAGMCHTTLDGRYVRVNQRFCDIVGYTRDELLARTFQDITHADDHALDVLANQRQLAGEVQTMAREKRYIHKDGSVVWVDLMVSMLREASGEPKYLIAVVQDITARRQLEQELLHAQRMEGVGQLAGGIAHDFNNLLTVIGGRSELALAKLQPADPLRRDLDLIKKTADRAAALTRQLLAFSRKQVIQRRVVDPNDAVDNSTNLLKRLIGEDIELVFLPAADLGRVRVDPGNFEQVIVNLAVNARDAMRAGGRLTIETSNVTLDAGYAGRHVGLTPGPYVMIAVSDNGAGMDAETQARIFEPFFTTKGPGKGTGLGLATVYGIVKHSEGHIRVYSEPGVGTVFKIYLPRTDAAPEAEPPGNTTAAEGTETVLLVEDEAEVRSLAREVLERLGYTLLEANSADDALLIAERHVGLIDLLLTDVVMPRMSGGALAEALASLRPETKILFMSGYTDDAIVRHGVLEKGVDLLEKPFSPRTLAAKVRAVLDRQ
ncbi:MAG TPA: PAS domain S-box protein [Candidatus Limnocylindria bacterium]|nr:PAS domain S-box protein [Candidatus Limnocylindria bacterium]